MSMISPSSYIDEYRDMPYENLLPVRDELVEEIRELEKNDDLCKYPNNTRYQVDIEHLVKLLELIAVKFQNLQWEDSGVDV